MRTLLILLPLAASGVAQRPAAFYDPPQLFVMTGFIANTTSGTWGNDFVGSGAWTPEKQQAALAGWNRGLGREYDADRVVLAFKDAGATGVIFYDKWHDGVVPHATRLTDFKTERDLVGPTIAALRKRDMKIVVYYSVGLDANPDPRFRDWTCLDAAGKPMGRAFPGDWKSFYSPYRQYVIGHLVEILKLYGRIDAFWLDLYTQPTVSHDRYTMEAFEKRYHKPLAQATAAEEADFVDRTRRDFLVDIRRAVSAVQPGIALTFNGSGMADAVAPKSAREVDALMDFFSMEGHRWDNIDRGARVGHNMDRPFEVGMLLNSSWYVPLRDQAPPPAMSAEEAIVSAATAWTQGSNVYAAMTPGHSGVFDAGGDMAALRAIGGWLQQHRRWLTGTTPFAEIGIVRGNASPELESVPPSVGLWENYRHGPGAAGRPGEALDLALRKAGYLTEFTGTAFARRAVDWKAFRLLVLPENALVDDALAGAVRDYVSGGGKLLALGHASLLDGMAQRRPDFALKDVLGASLAGDLPGYKQFAPLPEAALSSRLRLNAAALAVRPGSARPLAVWKSAGDVPALLENRFGAGQVIYIGAAESAVAESGLLEELAARLIGGPAIRIRAARNYSVVMNRKDDDLLLYVMNRSTGSRAFSESGMAPDPGLALGPEQVRITLDSSVVGAIARAELLPDGIPVRMSRRGQALDLIVNANPAVTALRLSR